MSELTAEAIEKIEDIVTKGVSPMNHPAGGEFVVIPENYTVEHLKPLDPPLSHIKQSVNFDDVESFCNYVSTFKTDGTAIFAAITAGKIIAILDYHGKAGHAAYCAHKATYVLPHSEQWKRWTGIDNKSIPQRSFAEFIEENIADVIEPAGAALLEVATSLQSTRKVEFHSGVNLGNGTVQLKYTEEDDTKTGKQALVIPQKIKLGIPVYFGDAPYGIDCFFRYRIEDGKLNFQIRIQGREMIVQDAFQQKAAAVQAATGFTVRFGSPVA